MSAIPENLLYTKEHEWLAIDGDVATIGITAHAADALGDIVYVALPGVGDALKSGAVVGEVESTKSVGEVFAPVAGEVVEINQGVVDAPDTVNSDPYGAGWLIKVRFSELPEFLDATAYQALTGE
ncbi:MAG: glycine cleavage system protein GcvH [Microbacteriaceae bacterium]|jgi:glycine cleavage system H protein|nr:MAG: glycine cleavage system protein H [Microbacteriaceae bacterium BACL25 MAG-120322-bin65]HAA79882.1 glycine cleavage system protein GcvH [Microbacteriaceae bacterium]|tara:strand:+ start:66 stop:440 length:375 start_codon:yes stop_codon:yes gene_type:complete